MGDMQIPLWVIYLSAGAYIAIMIAVLGVPQMLSSYFDLKARRLDRQENEANSERRHQEMLAAQTRREEREEERRREERRLDEERRRREEELRRQEINNMERRHHEMMVALVAALGRGNGQVDGEGRDSSQAELIRAMQQTIEELRAENERLRQQNGNGSSDP